MSRPRFRLDAVLRVRRLQEESARAALRLANADRSAAARAEEEARQDYARTPQPLGPSCLDDFLAQRATAERAAQAVSLRGAATGRADEAVSERRNGWMEAAARLSVMERLEERRRAEHRAELERREVAAAEEITTARALRERAERHRDGYGEAGR